MTTKKKRRSKQHSEAATYRHDLNKAKMLAAIAEANAETARATAKWHIASLCRDLVPVAATLARKGRPRLLAVISRILGDDKMRTGALLK